MSGKKLTLVSRNVNGLGAATKKDFIENDIYGSDHCPIGLVIEI